MLHPLFLSFTLFFFSLFEVAFLIFLSSVYSMHWKLRGFFRIVDSHLFFHSWKFREEREKETEKQERRHLTSSVQRGSVFPSWRKVFEGGER